MKDISEIRRNNLRSLIEKENLTREEFANILNMAYSQLAAYIGKNPTKNIGKLVAQRIESQFGLPENWLDQDWDNDTPLDDDIQNNYSEVNTNAGGQIESQNTTTNNYYNSQPQAEYLGKGFATWQNGDSPPHNMTPISYYRSAIGSLGSGYANDEYYEEEQLWFRAETIKECNVNPTYAKAIRVRGDSMNPELTDGQVIAIDTSAVKIFDGEIYAFIVSGELKVKYLFKHGNGFKAVSRNEDKLRFPDEIYTDKDIAANNISIIGQFWWKSETRRIRR